MILQSLHQLYDRLLEDPSYEISPPGFSPQKVSFKIVLREDGSLLEPQEVDAKVQTRVLGDAKPSGAGINPCFLWDNQTYLLGRQPDDKKDGFGQERFEAFKKRHLDAENEICSAGFKAVCRFLEEWNPARIGEYQLLEEVGTGFGVFQIQGKRGYVHDEPEVLEWWLRNLPKNPEPTTGQCLLTGKQDTPIARLHPKIKGISGAQSSGASLVSFNDTAYESYGKSQSFNSPVSEDAAFRYGTALNALLAGPNSKEHRIRIGETTCVFWTEKRNILEDCFVELFGSGSNSIEEVQDTGKIARLKLLFRAIKSGGNFHHISDIDTGTPFYLLGIAPNAARLSIRFFHRSTVGELLKNLHEHHNCLSIVREYEEARGKRFADPEFPAIWQLLLQAARVSDEIPPLLGGALARSIIEGTNYPEGLFAAIIRRIHAERTVPYLRASILKAILVRNHKKDIPIMLDKSNTNPAYLLGRLFAALEKTQEDAQGSLNAGLRDKYYSSASATPASVFPRILRTYQHHLAKLSEGGKINRERLVQDILGGIDANGFPKQLNLQDQGVFAIGYYHQRKDFFTKKPAAETSGEIA